MTRYRIIWKYGRYEIVDYSPSGCLQLGFLYGHEPITSVEHMTTLLALMIDPITPKVPKYISGATLASHHE